MFKETSRQDVIRACCPSCDDDRYHLYIYYGTRSGFCFRCSTYFRWRDLEASLGVIPDAPEYFDLEQTRSLDDIEKALYSQQMSSYDIQETELPKSVPAWEDKRSRAYLQARKVPSHLVWQHDIRFCSEGYFRHRVLVPVTIQGKTVTFSARDITGKKAKKYLFPAGSKPGNYLFNFDSIRGGFIIVVEGVFDALHLQKIGLPAVASFGKKITKRQQELLESFSRIVLMFDSDALEEISKYAGTLRGRSRAVLLAHGDPTDYSEGEILKMLRRPEDRLGIAETLLKNSLR